MKEEKKLIKKAKNGDEEAFGVLYDDHVTQIYRFIFLRVSKKQDAEDLAQKVFMKAWRNIESYEIRKNVPFSSWLYKIAKNTIIDHYRTSKDHASVEEIPEKELREAPTDHESKVDDSFRIQEAKEALNQLTDNQQNIIIMKFIEELSNEEIADILDKSEVAVRVTQHRALKNLKKILKEEPEEE